MTLPKYRKTSNDIVWMSFINVLGSVVSSYCRQTGERQWEEGEEGERERGRTRRNEGREKEGQILIGSASALWDPSNHALEASFLCRLLFFLPTRL